MSEQKSIYVEKDRIDSIDPEGLAAAGANTCITLFYRCGANYKSTSPHVLEGRVGKDAFEAILTHVVDNMGDGPAIYPQNLGLPHPILSHGLAYDDETDHCICAISDVYYTDDQPTADITAAEFEAKVAEIVQYGWDVESALSQITPDLGFGAARPAP
jgi:hypothetical protein